MKICPIRCLNGSSDTSIAPECMGGKCAWFVDGCGCAVLELAHALKNIEDYGIPTS